MELLEEGNRWAPVNVDISPEGIVTLKTYSGLRRFAELGIGIEGVGVLREVDHRDGVLLGVVIPWEAMGMSGGDAS